MSFITTITLSEHLDAKSAARLGLPAQEYRPGDQVTLPSDDAQSLFAAGYVRTSTPVASVPMLGGPNTWSGTQDFTGATVTGVAGGSGGGVSASANNTWTGTQNFSGASTPGLARLAGGNTFTGAQDFTGATVTGIAGGGTAASAWQFAPESYGAKGDGKLIGDLSVTNGSAVVTSASAAFVAGDVGKSIMINGAIGANNIALITTIASRQSATQVTLAATASVTSTGMSAIYGTNDTAAIQAAVDAASAYAQANEYYAEVVFKDRYYVVSSAPSQVAASPGAYNAQIKLPYPASNTTRKLVIALTGAGEVSHFQFWASTVPNLAGTCLVSMRSAPSTIDATFGPEAVLGGPNLKSAFTGNFANTKVVLRNLSIWCTPYTNQTGIELSWTAGCLIDGCSVHVFAQAISGNGSTLTTMRHDPVFSSRVGVGVRLPAIGNNADVWIPTLTVEGFTVGLKAAEHVRIGNLKTIYNDVALVIDTGDGLSSQAHGVNILGWTAEAYNGGILALGSGPAPVDIRVNTEDSASLYDVSDASNALRGQIHWSDSVDTRDPAVTGAAKVRVINDNQGPGKWASQPTIAASGTARQNTAWRDAMVGKPRDPRRHAGATATSRTPPGRRTPRTTAGSRTGA
jgi:hypothetical protein